MSYTQEIQMAAQPQALKVTVVSGKHPPTPADQRDTINWTTERPRLRQGEIVEGTLISPAGDKSNGQA